MSIEPKSKADQEKMGVALQRLSAEDPTFRTFTDKDTGQVIIAGMGELHLEIIRDRMFREFKVDADAGKPQIAYRESITGHAEGEANSSASLVAAASTVTPSSISSRTKKAKAPRSSTRSWAAWFRRNISSPLPKDSRGGQQWRRRRLPGHRFQGPHHRWFIPRSRLLGARLQNGRDFRLQACHGESPADSFGADHESGSDRSGGISGRPPWRHQPSRGHIQGIEQREGACIITALVPLETMFGYATDIRSLSKGRASYSMEPSHFDQVPAQLLTKIVETSNRAPART